MKKAKLNKKSLMAMYLGEEVENINWHQDIVGLYSTIEGNQYYIGRNLNKTDKLGWMEIRDKFINEHGWKLWERQI